MTTLIKNGTIITATDMYKADVLVKNGVVSEIGREISKIASEIIDAADKWVLPGAVDVHTHMDAQCDVFYSAYHVSSLFVILLIAYLAISVAYSTKLKELPLVDIFCIAAGFLLRLQAGGEASGVVISEWLFLSVFLLSLFLSSGKRLCEQNSMGDSAALHRKSLLSYPDGFLEGALYLTAAAALVTYAMYVISRHTLVYTVPLCTFGLLRYIFRVKAGLGGDPTESLINDVPLFVTSLIWLIMVGLNVYW